MPAQPIELAVLVDGLRSLGVTAPIVGSDILAVPDIERLARREGSRLVLMLPWSGLEAANPNAARESQQPALAAGDAVTDQHSARAVGMRAVAALQVWAHAIRRVSSSEPERVAEALRREAVSTVAGSIAFDAAGDARVPSYVPHTWHAGRWQPLAASNTEH